ncbi:MAG TPA: hypothetical protein VMR62_36720 [Bryobacteraceae bacterium]|jgi:hypothetical protein|nr:hypothetical protein [Bryobacteraceae bacterium]
MGDELKKHLESMEARIKAELTEVMRVMQSELLRGVAAYSGGMTLRCGKSKLISQNSPPHSPAAWRSWK